MTQSHDLVVFDLSFHEDSHPAESQQNQFCFWWFWDDTSSRIIF